MGVRSCPASPLHNHGMCQQTRMQQSLLLYTDSNHHQERHSFEVACMMAMPAQVRVATCGSCVQQHHLKLHKFWCKPDERLKLTPDTSCELHNSVAATVTQGQTNKYAPLTTTLPHEVSEHEAARLCSWPVCTSTAYAERNSWQSNFDCILQRRVCMYVPVDARNIHLLLDNAAKLGIQDRKSVSFSMFLQKLFKTYIAQVVSFPRW